MRRWLAAVVLVMASSPIVVHGAAERPDPLISEQGCERYRGVPIGANDSTQQFELMVCTTATGVTAKVQTSSLVSGWSVRQSVGSWDSSGKTLSLKETEFIESRPEDGWRFCLIDELELERTATGLTGTYVSAACEDRAELVLDKVALDAPGPPPTERNERAEPPAVDERPAPPKQLPPPANVPPEPAAKPEPPASGCGCTATDEAPPIAGFATLLLAFGLTRARTRTRARAPC